MDSSFSIHILGNGSASPNILRSPSAQWIQVEHQNWLMDCGEGTQFRLLEQGLKKSKLNGVIISHLHGDHYFGLFGLLTSMSLGNRNTPLTLIAPTRLKAMLDMLLNQGGYTLSFEINFIATDDVKSMESIYQDDYFSIDAFPLQHRIHCCGFKFSFNKTFYHLKPAILKELNIPVAHYKTIASGNDYKMDDETLVKNETLTIKEVVNKSYAYCSDTRYFEMLSSYVQDVDLLYHESTFSEDNMERALQTFHSTAMQAALVAKNANVGKLIIGHFSARYTDLDFLLDEAQSVFEATEIAEESKIFEIEHSQKTQFV